ncbi:MAG: XdhC family protein [Bacteroidota bacterium]
MKESALWYFIQDQLLQQRPVVFLCVLESVGSSPGRQGFKMAVTENELHGSIGGGIMEHKFVELARDLIRKNKEEAIVKKQVHLKNSSYQSGMICSGEQTVVVYRVQEKPEDILVIASAIEKNISGTLSLSQTGISFSTSSNADEHIAFEKKSETEWSYKEKTGFRNFLYIIGGGHVSLAFSKLMYGMDFYIQVFDDRPELNTLMKNECVHEKHIADYHRIAEFIPEGKNSYVVIMTFGYRSDTVVLHELIRKNFRYLGLLGSKAKVSKMIEELHQQNFEEEYIKKLHSPIGIQIKSQTPEEIAISIAAEIIMEKNSI